MLFDFCKSHDLLSVVVIELSTWPHYDGAWRSPELVRTQSLQRRLGFLCKCSNRRHGEFVPRMAKNRLSVYAVDMRVIREGG